ncbi:MAG TPA: Na/Pi symporter, partial [Chitinophagaceae bacterium]|nr:Na/Pi symporter [Chitinophagaceae bacterium]
MKKYPAFSILVAWISIFTFSIHASAKIQAPTDFIQNVTTTSGEESFSVSWNINYEAFKTLEEDGYTVSIKYNTEIGAKRAESGYETSSWKEVRDIDLHQTSYQLENLEGGTSYVVKVGVSDGTHTYWSKLSEAETERGWGLFRLLVIIGSLGLFIYGMKIMSEGIQQAAGNKLRNLLGSITSNRFKGVLTGFGITSVIQSSSVTTVMTVSFVNAGLFTLLESTG